MSLARFLRWVKGGMNIFPESAGSWLSLVQNNPHSKVAIVGIFLVANEIIAPDHLNIYFLGVIILCCLAFIGAAESNFSSGYIGLCSLL